MPFLAVTQIQHLRMCLVYDVVLALLVTSFPNMIRRTKGEFCATSGTDVVGLNNAVFWDMTPCASSKKRRFGGMYRLNHQSEKNA
jgi:hypothetical protein